MHSWAAGPRDELPEGVTYPTEASLRYFSRLIALARGDASSILAAFGRQPIPQILCWPRVNIDHLPPSALRGIAAYTTRKTAKALRAVSRCFASALLGKKKTKTRARKRRPMENREPPLCVIDAQRRLAIGCNLLWHTLVSTAVI